VNVASKHTIDLKPLKEGGAALGMVSLPVPEDADYRISVPGTRSQSVPVGFWPRSEAHPGGSRRTRRALLYFEQKTGIKSTVVELVPEGPEQPTGETGWSVEVVPLEDIARHSDEEYWHYFRQPCEVRLSRGGDEIRFALCIENETGLHRWQYVQVEKLWGGSLVDAYRIGGHIYTADESPLTMEKLQELGNIIVHPDCTIAASVYLLVFANGTAQATGHWINGRIYGGIGDQKGLPAVEVRAPKLNLAPAAHLSSEHRTNALREEGERTIWQPFENTTITIRHLPGENGVEDITIPASIDGLPMGVARSATWLMGVGDVEPAIDRYAAPPEWHAACQDFAPFPIELRDGEFERLGRLAAETILSNSVSGKFTSGGIYRYLNQYGLGCYELSMDANECRSLFRRAWRDSDARFHDLALRNAYFMADIAVDHTRDIIHYHGDNPGWRTYSLIYQRFSGIVLGYIETGDFYLLDTAEAVARNYMSLHLQNWPRHGIGRDADPLNGFLLLWDYTANEAYFDFARRFAHHVSLVIGENGEWRSGAGIGPQMGCNATLGSSWNGGHFLNGFTEYAMRDPDVPREWLEAAGRALSRLYDRLESEHNGYHPASSGFLGRIHWYLACRLGDQALIRRTRKLLDNVLEWERNPEDGKPIFTGPRAHHMNNYVDYLTFYEATKDTLPDMLAGS
jgi:hypothetical protein